MVSISAGICSQMFAIEATISSIIPMKRNLPIGAKSLLIVVDRTDIPKNMLPVPTAASPINWAPFCIPRANPSNLDSISPMKKVKPNRR